MAMAFTAPGESLRDIFGRFWPYMRGDRCRLLAAGVSAVLISGGRDVHRQLRETPAIKQLTEEIHSEFRGTRSGIVLSGARDILVIVGML
jgi:hypothetical protein